tara:strand:+ start:1161 stop:2825 length:1665 start_codon:yes stop_codon:yes gene_type:complete
MTKIINTIFTKFRGMVVLTAITFLQSVRGSRDEFEKDDWTFYIISAGACAFIASYGIGANDVANAFSTSVGSKALTIKQAVVLASIFEFSGAVLMGSNVSKTIRKGIADVSCYDDNPGLLIYGMTCVTISVGIWLILASWLEMPVSTTHSCVGGIIGMTLMTRGQRCVIWNYKRNQYGNDRDANMGWDNFPWLDGVAEIIASWILSPIASGVCASILYGLCKYLILNHKNAYQRAKLSFPIIVGLTTGINSAYWIVKGTKGQPERFGTAGLVRKAKNGNLLPTVIIGLEIGLGCAIITTLLLPFITKRINSKCNFEIKNEENKENEENIEIIEDTFDNKGVLKYVSSQLNQNPHHDVYNNEVVSEIHNNSVKHDVKAEEFFSYVQIFTAIVDSFSHGANDVANAMGPFAAAYVAYKKGKVVKSHELDDGTMMWILAIGGVGMILGLSTYGYKIMNAMGVKLTAITPSRGSCIELGAAFVIIYGTGQGIPLSTTHAQIGATVAVGLFEGTRGVNWKLFITTCFGWIITLVVVGCTTAMLVGPSPEPLKDEYCQNY